MQSMLTIITRSWTVWMKYCSNESNVLSRIVSGCRVKPPTRPGRRGSHTTARELQTYISRPRRFKHHQNSTQGPQEREKEERNLWREGKKTSTAGPSTPHPLWSQNSTSKLAEIDRARSDSLRAQARVGPENGHVLPKRWGRIDARNHNSIVTFPQFRRTERSCMSKSAVGRGVKSSVVFFFLKRRK